MPSRNFAFLLFLTFPAGALPASQTSTAPTAKPRMVEAPLLDCAGLPCIDMAMGSGKTLRLLIDTGDVNSYIDSKVARSLGLDLKGLQGNADGSTASDVQQTVVPGAKIGDLAMGDFPFMVLDTTPQPDRPGQKVQPLVMAPLLSGPSKTVCCSSIMHGTSYAFRSRGTRRKPALMRAPIWSSNASAASALLRLPRADLPSTTSHWTCK